jgi:hypothetical protein
MLIRTYQPNDFSYEGDEINWGIPFIQYAAKMGWSEAIITPPPGPVTDSLSDVKETRMRVAKMLTHASGRNYDFKDSIQFMLDTHLSHGKTAQTVEGFGMNDTLTRAEAVAFIMNLKSKLDVLYASPFKEQKYDPATANLSPAENMVLEVQKPHYDGMIKFSDVTFDPLQVGYKKISAPNYTISGKALNGLGNSLTIKVARKQANGFIEDKTYDIKIKEDGSFEQMVNFPEKGLYRITMEAQRISITK